jgi:hypothetical protein
MRLTKLENIPKIVRANGWLNGARLMEQWFSRPVKIKDDYGPPDTTTIKMDSWLLTFPRGRKAYQNIVDKKIWSSKGAQEALAKQLRRNGILNVHPTAQWSFGDLGLPVDQLHDKHITTSPSTSTYPLSTT